MQTFRHLKEEKRKYLLIPVMPTPNGSLHLGHLAGPFLKMDVLARAQRRNGNAVSLFFGTDVYESYMNLKAWQTGTAETELCNEYSKRIQGDLDALQIEYDEFINPLDEQHNPDFVTFFTAAVHGLEAKGLTEIRSEKILYSKEEDCYVTGCWISGACPVCSSGSGSYQCEDCGTQYRPMDLLSPSFKRGNYPLTAMDDKELYLIVRKKEELFRHLESMQIEAGFIDIITTYFKEQENYIRLTNAGKWGIPYQVKGSPVPHVLFTYSALYFYSLYCGELYKKKWNSNTNPFEKNTDVITVASFGIDCTVPYLAASVALGLEGDTYKPIDYILPNYFYTLENAKFSTSRGHAIWGAGIIDKTPVTADAVRYFLALHNPEHAMADFSVDAFLRFVNDVLANSLQPLLTKKWMEMQQANIQDAPAELVTRLESLLIQQHNCLTPPGFELAKSTAPLQQWIQDGHALVNGPGNAYWWLKGFALLSLPIMPVCASAVWNLLGHIGEPVEKDFFIQTSITANKPLPLFFATITFDDIKPALPATLFVNEL